LNHVNPPDPSDRSAESAAAQWLSRRDRGLSSAEQDAYLQWLQTDPANGREIVRLERVWARLDVLQALQSARTMQPNPDLLAPPRRRHRWIWPTALAAAAAVALVAYTWKTPDADPAIGSTVVTQLGPKRVALEDGSWVELNSGAAIDVKFTPAERGVRLLRGEAHFIVAKNLIRPFIVTADNLAVRAVGTAFAVHFKEPGISVLVTEGKVQLDEIRLADDSSAVSATELSRLVAGQEALVRAERSADRRLSLQVRNIAPAEIERAVAWQTLRLEFVDLPLREVVEEFNRFNSRKLVIGDERTGDIVVGGSFRADNVQPFVRLLDMGFGVSSYPRGEDIVLRQR
jgi:transmembrane sensor